MRKGGSEIDVATHHSVIELEHDEVVLRLARRKNTPQGSVMRRSCWCRQCKHSCPVMFCGSSSSVYQWGAAPFVDITGFAANALLKECCEKIEFKKACLAICHDLRRGHAKDLQLGGATLREILEAGQWSSAGFFKYLDLDHLERDLVVSAHLAERDEEP